MPTPTTPPPDPPLASAIERRLAVDRLRPYRVAVGGDLQDALALYEWNSAVAGAFFEALGHFEVVLRNALHEQLSAWHTNKGRIGEWYEDPTGVLDERTAEDVAQARDKLGRAGKTEAPGKVIAELNFGFWRFLLADRYETKLWWPALQHAFPGRRRKDVSVPVNSLNILRNRIAHHEPIHRMPLQVRHDDLLRVMGFIDPEMEAWLSSLSRVPTLLGARP